MLNSQLINCVFSSVTLHCTAAEEASLHYELWAPTSHLQASGYLPTRKMQPWTAPWTHLPTLRCFLMRECMPRSRPAHKKAPPISICQEMDVVPSHSMRKFQKLWRWWKISSTKTGLHHSSLLNDWQCLWSIAGRHPAAPLEDSAPTESSWNLQNHHPWTVCVT